MNNGLSERARHPLATFGITCHGLSYPAIQLKHLEADDSYAFWLFTLPVREQARRIALMEAERKRQQLNPPL